jgi:predicted DNA-binding transcriptional regulator YafY
MSRSERLLALMQSFRRRSRAVSAKSLSAELGVHIRTVYRDISTLQEQGVPIEGEAGIGYILRSGFTLPPLMFSLDELESLLLGARWVALRGDTVMSTAAIDSIAKIKAVLPPKLRTELEATTVIAGPSHQEKVENKISILVRESIRTDKKILIKYEDKESVITERTVWPFCLCYFDLVQIMVAWCELRNEFRNFRMNQIVSCVVLNECAPEKHDVLMSRWQEEKTITDLGVNF